MKKHLQTITKKNKKTFTNKRIKVRGLKLRV